MKKILLFLFLSACKPNHLKVAEEVAAQHMHENVMTGKELISCPQQPELTQMVDSVAISDGELAFVIYDLYAEGKAICRAAMIVGCFVEPEVKCVVMNTLSKPL